MCFCKFVFLCLNLCVLGCPKTSVFLVFEVFMYHFLSLSLSLSVSLFLSSLSLCLSLSLALALALSLCLSLSRLLSIPPPCTCIQDVNVCGQAARESLFLKSNFIRTMRVGKAKGDSFVVDQDIANPSQIGVNACGCGCRCGCVGEGGTFISCVFYLTKRNHSLSHTHKHT